MKRLILLIVILASAASQLSAARLYPSTGRVVDEQGNAVEYATVVLLKGSEQVAGRTTDAPGAFRTESRAGQLHAANPVPRVRPREKGGPH